MSTIEVKSLSEFDRGSGRLPRVEREDDSWLVMVTTSTNNSNNNKWINPRSNNSIIIPTM